MLTLRNRESGLAGLGWNETRMAGLTPSQEHEIDGRRGCDGQP